MNNTTKSLILGCSVFAAVSAQAEIETAIHAGYHSIYEFRGVNLGDDLFTAGIDASTEIADGLTLSGGVWYGDTDGNNLLQDFDEVDLYIGLTKDLGGVDLSFGYTHYTFPGDDAETDEFYVGLATELQNGVGLSLTYYRDVNAFEAGYLEAEVTKSYELNPCVNLDLSAGAAWSFGYNADFGGGSVDGFNHAYVSAAAPWAVGGNFTITPYIKYTFSDSDLVSNFDASSFSDLNDDLFLGGVSFSYSF